METATRDPIAATTPPRTSSSQRGLHRYDRMSEPMEHMLGFGAERAGLFAGLRGEVVELGVGTGRNIQHYPRDAHVVAIDISREMLAAAVRKARASAARVAFAVADAEDPCFRDGIFDAVVASGVFAARPTRCAASGRSGGC
jgi:ubiquinone/menaquinone biosynthesis C-methylase UbiE